MKWLCTGCSTYTDCAAVRRSAASVARFLLPRWDDTISLQVRYRQFLHAAHRLLRRRPTDGLYNTPHWTRIVEHTVIANNVDWWKRDESIWQKFNEFL